MAKELPYFKFHVSEWINGDITLEPMEEQGAFINICAYYWFKDGKLTLAEAKRRLTQIKPTAFVSLSKKGFLKQINGFLKISFLDEQLKERDQTSIRNSENGKKGGRPKETDRFILGLPNKSDMKANTKPIREEERREEKEKNGFSLAPKALSLRIGAAAVLGKKYAAGADRGMMNEGADVDLIFTQMGKDEQKTYDEICAMVRHHKSNGLMIPTKVSTIIDNLSQTNWKTKGNDAASDIENLKAKPKVKDEIGTSKPGSLS